MSGSPQPTCKEQKGEANVKKKEKIISEKLYVARQRRKIYEITAVLSCVKNTDG